MSAQAASAGVLCDCGHVAVADGVTSGCGRYGTRTLCFTCCGLEDARIMRETGRHEALYLTRKSETWFITNWPGTLTFEPFKVRVAPRGGGFGSQRTDAWFTGPDGAPWHAVNRGDMTLARCKRVKAGERKRGAV